MTLQLPVSPGSTDGPSLARRGRRALGPLLLYLLIALGLLFPYRSNALRPMGDLPTVVALTLQADHALREGQFPIRIAPDLMGGARYPVFQFYGNFPYTVTGALSILFHNPYTGWKIACVAALVGGGYFTMRLSVWLSGSFQASILAGTVFLCAPYLMTDLNARGAFSEMAAFCIMPAAIYSTLRCLASARWRRIVGCAFAWTLLGLTHNITYLYGVIFTAAFCLPFLASRRGLRRVLRLGGAGLIHAAMILWYLVPQYRSIPLLNFKEIFFNPFQTAGLATLNLLLAPSLTTTLDAIGTPNLGLQIGWPILGGVLLALAALFVRRPAAGPRRRAIVLLFALFALALFMAWSPVDFWLYLPRTLWFVQFPYRLLLFVVLFGCGLAACGLGRLFRTRVPGAIMLVGLAAIGWAVASYLPSGAPQWRTYVPSIVLHPEFPGLTEYLISADAVAATSISNADPENIDWDTRLRQIAEHPEMGPVARIGIPKSQVRYGVQTHVDYVASGPTWLEIPVLAYPGLLDVRDNGRRVPYQNAGRFVALRMGRGPHKIAISFLGVKWANIVGVIAWIAVVATLLMPVLQPLADRMGAALAAMAKADYPAFSPREALIGSGVLLVCAVLPIPLWRWLRPLPPIRLVASPSNSPPEKAFDHDPATAWIAQGSGPATLDIQLDRPKVFHGLVLESRLSRLNECWQHVSVRLFNSGQPIYIDEFDFPDAWKQPAENIKFDPILADRIELFFSKPVLTRPDGRSVTADQVKPGYREIRILWGQ